MHRRGTITLALIVATLSAIAACGGGSSPAAPTGPVQPPPAPSPQEPTANVTGRWEGTESNSGGSGTIRLELQQENSTVTGMVEIVQNGKATGGDFSGTVSGNMLTFTIRAGQNCPTTINGTTTITATDQARTDLTMTGTFSGQDCRSQISNGRLSLTTHRPNLVGTWIGEAPSSLGGQLGKDGWRWQLTQMGFDLSGTVSVDTTDVHETGTFSGRLGFQIGTWRMRFSITLTGSCPGTLEGHATDPVTERALVGTFTSQSTCRTGQGPQSSGFSMRKQ